MNRPHLVNFSAISNKSQLTIKMGLAPNNPLKTTKGTLLQSTPIQSISLFSKQSYRVKIIGLNDKLETAFTREYESDNFGKFEIVIALGPDKKNICKVSIFETSILSGIELHLGSFLPLEIKNPNKIIISDFDKTLVDTKYSTPKEMYYSLSRPLNYFPTVQSSVKLLKDFIADGHQPFILSASPHFYENAIRDWLYQNNIFASNILLKDYRDFFSLFEGALSTKDLTKHGFYKLNQLINVLLMTGIPDSLVLLGDGFESDPAIYLTLKNLLTHDTDPWQLWKSIKHNKIFNLTTRQDSYFITKFYQLHEMAKNKKELSIQIHIRSTASNIEKLKTRKFKDKKTQELSQSVNYYI